MPEVMESQLGKLKARIGITDKDALLEQLLEESESDILIYCNRTELPDALRSAQLQLALLKFNKLGAEGESSRSEGAISRSFEEEITDSMRSKLNPYRRAKLVSYHAP